MYAATPVSVATVKENTADVLSSTHRTLRGYPVVEPEGDDHKQNLVHILEEYETRLKERTQLHLGYPYNLDFDFSNLQTLQQYRSVINCCSLYIVYLFLHLVHYSATASTIWVILGWNLTMECIPENLKLVSLIGLPNCGTSKKKTFGDTSLIAVSLSMFLLQFSAQFFIFLPPLNCITAVLNQFFNYSFLFYGTATRH